MRVNAVLGLVFESNFIHIAKMGFNPTGVGGNGLLESLL
jgi:hypothetical protein